MELLGEFEDLIVLRTILDSKKKNVRDGYVDYISIDDLEEIVLIADEMNIDLKHIDFYNENLNSIAILEEWSDDINSKYNEIKEKLSKKNKE